MNILLDTHILIWALNEDPRLPEKAKEMILDEDNRDSIEEIMILPAWLDEADTDSGPIIFLECGDFGDDADTSPAHHAHNSSNPYLSDYAAIDEIIQFGACRTVGNGEKNAKDEIFSNLFVAFWDGATSMFVPKMPHPWIDSFDTDYSYVTQNTDTPQGTLTITWRAIYANHPFSQPRIRSGSRAHLVHQH